MDRGWWNEYGPGLQLDAEFWTTNREAARVYRLNHIVGEPGGGLAKRPGAIRLGGNSGFQALSLALYFGAARVILLGYDMHNDGRRTHWHGDHKRLGNPLDSKFDGWIKAFDELRRDLPRDVQVLNATPGSALRAFPRKPLGDCLSAPPARRS